MVNTKQTMPPANPHPPSPEPVLGPRFARTRGGGSPPLPLCAGGVGASVFVLAGLDPAIHGFDAHNEDVDTRDKPAQDDFTLSVTECEQGMPEARISPDSPALCGRGALREYSLHL
jgi:hypothetical protein